jgi:hypothetical protein
MSEQTSERERLLPWHTAGTFHTPDGDRQWIWSDNGEVVCQNIRPEDARRIITAAEEIAALRQRVEACDNQLVEARATNEALRKDVVRMNYLETRVRKYDGQFFRGIGHELPGFHLTSSSLRVHIDAALAHSTPAPVNEEKGE